MPHPSQPPPHNARYKIPLSLHVTMSAAERTIVYWLHRSPNYQASPAYLAERIFPLDWKTPASRGGRTSRVRRACDHLCALGICIPIPNTPGEPQNQFTFNRKFLVPPE